MASFWILRTRKGPPSISRFCAGWMTSIIFPPDPGDLQKMLRDVVSTVRPAGLLLQPTKCQWSTNVEGGLETVSVLGRNLMKVPASPGLEILGTMVALNADSTVEHDARLAKTWRAYWANHGLLLNRRVNPLRRVRLLNSVVSPTALWAVGGLTHTVKQVNRFDCTMRAMTARILGIRRTSQELWVPWHRRTRRKAGKVLTSLGIHPWGTSLCLKTLTWAGHVARLPESRLCKQVLRWRDLEWWRRRQALIELGFPQLRHPQGPFGHPCRWETAAEKCANWAADLDHGSRDWHERAANRYSWKRLVLDFLGLTF